MKKALNLSEEEDLKNLLNELGKDDMDDMESMENIDRLCQDINFDEEIFDTSNKENKSPKKKKKNSPKKTEPIVQPFTSTEKKSPSKYTSRPPLTHIAEPISDEEVEKVNI